MITLTFGQRKVNGQLAFSLVERILKVKHERRIIQASEDETSQSS